MNNIFSIFHKNLQDELDSEVRVQSRSLQKNKQSSLKMLGEMDSGELQTTLGPGPMRFASQERPIDDQIESLRFFQRESFESIKQSWENPQKYDHFYGAHTKEVVFDDATYLNFARCHHFNEYEALKHMHKFNPQYLTLTCKSLEKQLLTRTLFQVPGLQTSEGLDCFYMRPSRYFPRETSVKDIIDNLVYVFQCMQEKEFNSAEGVAFIANMADWKMENFSVPYCHEFMKVLMGHVVPTNVRLFLIVDPPTWFGSVWTIMCQVLTKEFTKRIHLIRSTEIGNYLADEYEKVLPDEISGGMGDTKQMVSDFVTYRKFVERKNRKVEVSRKSNYSIGADEFISTDTLRPGLATQ